MVAKQKLELTWIGKEKRARLEPRILIEVPEKSHHAATRRKDGKDNFDNMLIHGDNLLALKALEQKCTGKKKLYATVQVKDVAFGESRKLIDVAAAGEGARIVAYELAMKLGKKTKPAARRVRPPIDDSADDEGDGSTPAQLWASGIKNVPTQLPEGYVAFLPMKAEFYEDIECGVKRAEYRSDTAKYKAMFGMKKPVAVRLQYGYTKRQMAWQVVKVNYEPDEGYEICLGKRLF